MLSFLVFLFIPSAKVSAQSGCCSWHGGESYCDSTTGRWVCNDGTYSPSCTCGGGYYYTPPIPTIAPIPSCPLMSTYNYASGKCECMYGYVFNGSYCISQDQACSDQYGYNSTSDYSGGCKCRYGYVWNSSRTKCISEDQACQDQFGVMSIYNVLTNTCDCLAGYSIQGGTCQYTYEPPQIIIPTETETPIPVYMPTPTLIPSPTPIPAAPKFPQINATWDYLYNRDGTIDLAMHLEDSNPTSYSVIVSKYAGQDPGPLADFYTKDFVLKNLITGREYVNVKKNISGTWSTVSYWTLNVPSWKMPTQTSKPIPSTAPNLKNVDNRSFLLKLFGFIFGFKTK